MYGTKLRPVIGLCGLRTAQLHLHTGRVIKNAGWYNAAGERLGWGDLSGGDVQRLAGELVSGEVFIVLSEWDANWSLRELLKRGGRAAQEHGLDGRSVEAPGMDYVALCCSYLITARNTFLVSRFGTIKEKTRVVAGVSFRVITADEAREIIVRAST